ncbi:MAG TPA: protein kinase, partial [Chloroflexota bacterium]|nr:protein kinase [Chloroflexota bacterium]
MEPLLGTPARELRVLGGRYALLHRLGAGGMAEVYLALDQALDRQVAVKLLHPAYAADPLFVERFRREARAAAALNHPHIVSVYDWGTDGAPSGWPYMVMEYVPGPNLKEELRRRGALPEPEALRIGEQVAGALAAAHARGMVHRDVKPHNILLLRQEEEVLAKVTDFGIARTRGVAGLTTGSGVLGSAHYLSPEQAQSRPLDGRSDLYSLGVVLYEALTGGVPFKGDVPVAVAWQHVHRQPAPLREARPLVSPATEAVVLTAMAKRPEARYPSAEAMALALASARAGGAGAPGAPIAAALVTPPVANAVGGPDGAEAPPAVRALPVAAVLTGGPEAPTAVLPGGRSAGARVARPDAPTTVLAPPPSRARPQAVPRARRGGGGILWGFGALVAAGTIAGGVAYWGAASRGGGPPAAQAQPGSPPAPGAAPTAPPVPPPTTQPVAAPTTAPTTAPTAAPPTAPTTAPT